MGASTADLTYRSWADLNADGKIDKTDVDLLNAHNGETCAKPPAH